jgi:hypothetical protein
MNLLNLVHLVYGVIVYCLVRLNVYFCQLYAFKICLNYRKMLLKSLLNGTKSLLQTVFWQYSVMTEPEPELSGTRNCRVAHSASIFQSLFILDRIWKGPNYKDRNFGLDRTPTPTRVNLIVILMTYVRYLYSINCPTEIFYPACCYLSYGETQLVNCGPRSNFLYIAITVYYLLAYLHSCILLPFTTRYAQSFVYSKPVRLTTSSKLGAKFLVVLCAGFTLLLGEEAPTSTTHQHFLALLSGVSRS